MALLDRDEPPDPAASAPPASPATSAGRALLITVAVLHVVVVAFGLVAGLFGAMMLAMPAAFAVMMFDDPASTSVIWTNLLAYGLLTAPVVLGAAALTGALPLVLTVWGVVRSSPAPAVIGLLLTLVIFALPLLNVAAVVVGAIGLDTFCDGRFGCQP